MRGVLLHAAPSPAGLPLARVLERQPARDRARGKRSACSADLAQHHSRPAAGGRRDHTSRRDSSRGLMKLINRHRVWQAAVDACLVAIAWYLAFALRFDFAIPNRYEELIAATILLVVVIKVAVLTVFGLYNHWWRYVSIVDMWS